MRKTEKKPSLLKKLLFKISTPWIRTVIYIFFMLLMPEYFAPVFALLALAAAIRDAVSSKRPLFAGTSSEPMLLILLLTLAGLIYSPNKFSTVQAVGLWFSACVVYLALVSVITTRRRLERTVWAITVALAINAIIAFFQFFLVSTLKFDLYLSFWRYFDNAFLGLFGKNLYYFEEIRSSSTFCNPNVFSQSMAMLLPFALYYGCSHRRDIRHNTAKVLVPLAFFGTLFSFSRGVYLALIIVLLAYAFYHIKNIKFILIALVVVILLIPSSVYSRFLSINEFLDSVRDVFADFSSNGVNYEGSLLDYIVAHFEAFLTKSGVDSSMDCRFDAWGMILKLIAQKPVIGYGAGYVTVRDVLREAGVPIVFHAHNFFFQTLLEGGFLMFSSYIWLIARTVKKGMYVLRRSSSPKIGLSVECFITAFIVSGITDVPTLTPKTMYSFILGVAIAEAAFGLYYERHPVLVSESFPIIGKLIPKAKLKD